jgi:hypothetical protein
VRWVVAFDVSVNKSTKAPNLKVLTTRECKRNLFKTFKADHDFKFAADKRGLQDCVDEEKNIPEYVKRLASLKRTETSSFYANSVIIIKMITDFG